MAGFADIIRSGVAIADNLTQSLQPNVLHEAFVGKDGEGGYSYATGVQRAALVERKTKMVRNAQGEEVVSTHVVTLLRPVAANGSPGRREPIDPRDKFTLPDGSKPKILSIQDFTDKDTGSGYFYQVYLG